MAEDTWKPDADRLVTNDLQMLKYVSRLKKKKRETKCQAAWQEGAKHLPENNENQNKQQ